MTPLVFGLTERVIAAFDLPETSWVRLERLHRRAINSIAEYEQAQCKVVHNNRRRFEMSDKASSGVMYPPSPHSEGEGHTFESCRVRHFGTELGTPKPAAFAFSAATSVRRSALVNKRPRVTPPPQIGSIA